MKTTALSLAMLLVPAALCAQANGQDVNAKSHLESAQSALIAGGRLHPTTEEIVRGAAAMDHGVTKKQISILAHSMADDNRSLAVALDVVTKLAASGKPVARAVAELQSNITSGASDETLEALTTPGTRGTLTTAVGRVARRP
ncbi:MAG TPA: hypothetical protein VGQ30_06205 [Gemmatimonadaceae bacterium]|jgi:hypothetical protein|nr:hypothetical protein [Gemmatimonadaceae bacterium]